MIVSSPGMLTFIIHIGRVSHDMGQTVHNVRLCILRQNKINRNNVYISITSEKSQIRISIRTE